MADKRKPIQQEGRPPAVSPVEPALAAKGIALPRAGRWPRRERRAPTTVEKIVSGGQTGADRAALDFAIAHGIPHGGWCPRGRWAEDGALEQCYELRETPEEEYPQRTEWNVRDSDGTVVFSIAPVLTGGSRLTAELAGELGKPCLHLSQVCDGWNAAGRLQAFISEHHIRVLNVAGPRASNEPAVARFVIETLEDLFGVTRPRSKQWKRYS